MLVIRGGAIGDFVLTLPALRLIRESLPTAHVEVLGYRPMIDLALMAGYADAVRSIEYSAMAGFFAPGSKSCDLRSSRVGGTCCESRGCVDGAFCCLCRLWLAVDKEKRRK